jgi:alpha-tubulin suppressor-like RCC1 family protein
MNLFNTFWLILCKIFHFIRYATSSFLLRIIFLFLIFTYSSFSAGEVYSCGSDQYGQLCLGDEAFQTTPQQVGAATNWSSVASREQSLAIQADGTLWVWGMNNYSILGYAITQAESSIPTKVGTATNWATTSAGNTHSLAIKTDGTLWAWGYNPNGQMGIAGFVGGSKATPFQVGVATNWSKIDTKVNHSLAIKTDGTLWAWGYNSNGQLGDGTTTDVSIPQQIGTDTDWLEISSGDYFSLALKSNGTLWAWGMNSSGRLGDGTITQRTTPIQVGTDTDWYSIKAGGTHTIALKTNGTIWAWGYNSDGQLGDGTNTTRLAPVQIGVATNWAKIGTSYTSSFAIKTDGTLWSWGYNGDGQLGNGSFTSSNTPVQVGTETNWSKVHGGYNFAMGIKTDGTLWAWGADYIGQLGLSRNLFRSSLSKVGSLTTWTGIATSSSQHSILLNQAGTIWTTGQNSAQLGLSLSSYPSISTLTQIGTNTNWGSVSTGHRFSFAITNNLQSYFWGSNNVGQLGDGTNTQRTTPVLVNSSTTFTKITSGLHTLAIKTDGTLWAWGYNAYGGIGDGTTTNRTLAVQIGTSNWIDIASRGSNGYSLAIKSDSTLWAWGLNNLGQLGDGTAVNKLSPIQIGTASNWKKVFTGGNHSFAIKSDGTLWAWGYNNVGQLGDGTTVNKSSPVQIGTATNWHILAGGSGHTLALKTNGTLWAWGYNAYGQLGDGTTTQRNSPVQIGIASNWSGISAGGNSSLFLNYIPILPTVTTSAISNITGNSAFAGGNVTDDGDSTINYRGVVWSTSPNPTVALNTKTINGSGTGAFSSTITGLYSKTKYYIRSYATNSQGTAYGDEDTIQTPRVVEDDAPNNGDANNDGIQDSQQDYVSSIFNNYTNKYITIESLDGYSISLAEIQYPNDVLNYYPASLVKFTISQSRARVKIYYHNIQSLAYYSFKKLNSQNTLFNFTNYTFGSEVIDGKTVATATLTLTDGGPEDYDGIVNGSITDPGGPAILAADANIPVLDWRWLSLLLVLFGIVAWKREMISS